MQEVYEKLNKVIDLIRFIFICLSAFYGVIWFYCAINLPSGWIYNTIINFIPDIIRTLFRYPYIVNNNRQVDMSFLIVAVVFFGFYLIAMYLVKWTDDQAYKCELGNIEQRKKIENLVNAELEEENKQLIMEYDNAAVLIKLHFNYLIDPNIIENRTEISDVEKESYTQLIKNTNFPYQIKRGRYNNQAYFIIEKFWNIEHFISTILKVIKGIYKENLAKEIKTSFTISVDAIRSFDKYISELKNLSKILSFEYRNKVVVTLPFVRRYEMKENKIFDLHTIGTSRYFEKIEDENGRIRFDTQDFELYYIRFKNKKTH